MFPKIGQDLDDKTLGKLIVGVDVTAPCSYYDFNQVIQMLDQWCGKYVFQKERGKKTDYDHWQIRARLRSKVRIRTILGDFFPHSRVTPTSKGVHKANNFNYVMKGDTRVDGPWTDKDYEEPPVLTRQLRTFMKHKLYPWQADLQKMVKEEEDRYVRLIYEHRGCTGKSIFCEFLEYMKLGYEIPPFRMMEDIMACTMSISAKKCYFIDMPRGMKKDKLGDFYSGIESLKNGQMYDKRYKFRKRRIDRPQIVVFTNMLPQFNLMSIDRWKVYEINDNMELTERDIVSLPRVVTNRMICSERSECSSVSIKESLRPIVTASGAKRRRR